MTIQILNTLKSIIGLQDQAFKDYKKWMPPYKERGGSLEKCLSLYLNMIKQPKTHQISHEIPPFIYKVGVQVLKCFWSPDFSSWLLTLVTFTSSTVV